MQTVFQVGATYIASAGDRGESDVISAVKRSKPWKAIINLDDSGQVTSIVDARSALEIYRGSCQALGLDCSKLIVHGE